LPSIRFLAAVEIPYDADGMIATSSGRAWMSRANSSRARSAGAKKSAAETCHGRDVCASAPPAASRTALSIGAM
jgi:hypothetical protein